ncbi:hypothetical protein BDZ85DRAFT_15287 [Elsinoe ampelina]|uniref:Uncharacterized protein n=1 Tax=Elsinoe ampelina TaxID=302913 RepID=A0A6A6G6Y1_9PEZI|nr:hypothetical protein BDZ85DRAFT_15287 [Elsinoe ampelina]
MEISSLLQQIQMEWCENYRLSGADLWLELSWCRDWLLPLAAPRRCSSPVRRRGFGFVRGGTSWETVVQLTHMLRDHLVSCCWRGLPSPDGVNEHGLTTSPISLSPPGLGPIPPSRCECPIRLPIHHSRRVLHHEDRLLPSPPPCWVPSLACLVCVCSPENERRSDVGLTRTLSRLVQCHGCHVGRCEVETI